MNVVVLGGAGHFGRVIAEVLVQDAAFRVVIAGRDPARTHAAAAAVGCAAAVLDARDPALARRLQALGADVVISAAGPFQGQDYHVARACIAAGCHAIDLADDRHHVAGITALDSDARRAGVLVVSGASSVPALSSAVVDALAPAFARLDAVDIAISTAAALPGEATARAVLAGCGKPFVRLHDGANVRVHAWSAPRRRRWRLAALTRWIAECEVPDLDLLPQRHPTLRSVRFRAGAEVAGVQWGVAVLAWLVRARMVRDAGLFLAPGRAVARRLERLGSGRSAMAVEVRGVTAEGATLTCCWELAASDDRGRRVPAMAAVALARKLANGFAARGAMPCVGLLDLADYMAELSDPALRTEVFQSQRPGTYADTIVHRRAGGAG